MWGDFQETFEHDVPSSAQWKDLAGLRQDGVLIFRVLPSPEKEDLFATLEYLKQLNASDCRYNFTVRFFEKHLEGCRADTPKLMVRVNEPRRKTLNVPRSAASSTLPPQTPEIPEIADAEQSSVTSKRFRVHTGSHKAPKEESPKPEEEHEADASSSQLSDEVKFHLIEFLQHLPNVSNLLCLARVLPVVQQDVTLFAKYCEEQEQLLLQLQKNFGLTDSMNIVQKQANVVSHALARKKVMCAP